MKGDSIIASYEVAIKRIVSPDGIMSEAKSVAISSGDGESEVHQSISVNISTSNSSSSIVKLSSTKSSKASSFDN